MQIWNDVKHRELSAGRTKAHSDSKGWHKAADVFLEDLYIVWRAMEGLDIWPSYYAAKLGYMHGGKISVNAPTRMTVEDALAVVGYVGGVTLDRKMVWSVPVEAPEESAMVEPELEDEPLAAE